MPETRRIAFRIWLSMILRGRPPRSFPASLRLLMESVTRSCLTSCSIEARAAIIIISIEPMVVAVSTSPPPRISTRRPAPRLCSYCANASMFWVNRPSRSSAMITKVSPRIKASRVRSSPGRVDRAPDTPWSAKSSSWRKLATSRFAYRWPVDCWRLQTRAQSISFLMGC